MDKLRNSTCIFCFKPATQSQTDCDGNKRNFFSHFTRHLKIPLKNFTTSSDDTDTDNLNGLPNNLISQTQIELQFCEQCFKVEESFCDLYFQLEDIRSQLDAKVKTIYETIVDGDKKQLTSGLVNECLPPENEKEAEVDLQKLNGDIQRFRKDIIKHCELKFQLRSSSKKPDVQFISAEDLEENVNYVKVETVSCPLDQDENKLGEKHSNTLATDPVVKYEDEVTIIPDPLESITAEYPDEDDNVMTTFEEGGGEDEEDYGGANTFSEDIEMILPDVKDEPSNIYEYEGDEDHDDYDQSDSSNGGIELGSFPSSSSSLFLTNYVPSMTVAASSPVQLQNARGSNSSDLLLDYFPMPVTVRTPDTLIRLNPKQVAPKELPGNCPICKKRFNCLSKERLQSHIKIEHGVEGKDPNTILYCSVCKVPFTHKTFLDRHERNDHSQPKRRKIFQCVICKKKLFSASSLREHTKSQHVYLPKKIEKLLEKM